MKVDLEKQTIRSAARGDRAAFEALVTKYLPQAYRFAYGMVRNREDAEDVIQEAFVKVWKHLGEFDTKKSFAPWFLQIVKRTALDALKKKRAVSFSIMGLEWMEHDVIDATQHLEEMGERALLGDRFATAMDSISSTSADVVRLHKVEGLTFEQIFRRTGESVNTIKSRYRRAIARLRKVMDNR